mgnify:CR=1 FL=1
MTKKKNVFKIIGLVLVSLFCFGACVSVFRGKSQTQPQQQTQTEAKTVNEACESASGAFSLKLRGEKELIVSEEEKNTYLGGEKTESITITGGTINVTGGELAVIEAANAGTLTFKSVTIKDKTENSQRVAYCNYIRFSGKLRFENCTIDSIYLKNGAQAEFINCTFISSTSQWYSVWVADGSAQFKNCKFTGYRGLKINEFEKEDVLNVSINGCTFDNLSEKPGVVIGKFLVDPLNGVITITNNRFINCQPWDNVGSIEGVDGIYESDILTSELNFTQENNVLEFTE